MGQKESRYKSETTKLQSFWCAESLKSSDTSARYRQASWCKRVPLIFTGASPHAEELII